MFVGGAKKLIVGASLAVSMSVIRSDLIIVMWTALSIGALCAHKTRL